MRRRFLLFAWDFPLAWSPFPARVQEVTAMAASSRKEPGAACAARGHPAARFVLAASSVLTRQVEHGAPTGIVASADEPHALVALLTGAAAAPSRPGCSFRQ